MAFVKLVGSDGIAVGSWAELSCLEGDTVARLAKRACEEFPVWRVTAVEVSLYRVEWTGAGDPDAAAERAALSGVHLPSRMTLDEAGIKPGSCVLLRKITGAAASGACARAPVE